MNYLTEIIAFNDIIELNGLSTGEIALWYALMYVNNKCKWASEFTVTSKKLQLLTGLSRSGIMNARENLKKCGLIEFYPHGTNATSYKMNSLC